MKITNEYSTLLDLSTIISGQSYAGIPQDTRLLFKTFAETSGIKPVGLVCGSSPKEVTFVKFKQNNNSIMQALAYTDYFFKFEKSQVINPTVLGKMDKLINKSKQAYEIFLCCLKVLKHHYSYHESMSHYSDYIWRKAFNGFIDSSYKDLIIKQNFVLSDFNKSIFTQRLLNYFPIPFLATPNIDFAIFQSGLSQCPRVSKETIPIIRYHDSVPLTHPDTVADGRMSTIHAKSLLASSKIAYFVCNSQPVCDELVNLVPSLEKKAFVIAPSHSFENVKIDKNEKLVANIINARKSGKIKNSPVMFHSDMYQPFNYIISVSTLEPRKNFLSLIRAWERIRYLRKHDLKLIIVGSPGWKFESILAAMNQHVLNGNIFHLEKVPAYELAILYAHAQAFIFPTYYEGFGSTPIEAMHMGCPIVVSDTPTTRWVLGDAALYCNPYDVSSIADSIEKLLYSSNSKDLSESLIKNGHKRIKKYTTEVVGAQWLNLFDQLKSKNAKG